MFSVIPEGKSESYWLRVTKRGKLYQYAYSIDGENYTVVGEKPWGNGAPKWVGIYAKNGGNPEAADIDAQFDFFEVRSLTDAEKNDPLHLERQKLQGAWEVVSFANSGEPMKDASLDRFVFDDGQLTVGEKTETLKTQYTLDIAKKPKQLVLSAFFGQGMPVRAVYSLNEDTLIDLPRPSPRHGSSDGSANQARRRPAVDHPSSRQGERPRTLNPASQDPWSWPALAIGLLASRHIPGAEFPAATPPRISSVKSRPRSFRALLCPRPAARCCAAESVPATRTAVAPVLAPLVGAARSVHSCIAAGAGIIALATAGRGRILYRRHLRRFACRRSRILGQGRTDGPTDAGVADRRTGLCRGSAAVASRLGQPFRRRATGLRRAQPPAASGHRRATGFPRGLGAADRRHGHARAVLARGIQGRTRERLAAADPSGLDRAVRPVAHPGVRCARRVEREPARGRGSAAGDWRLHGSRRGSCFIRSLHSGRRLVCGPQGLDSPALPATGHEPADVRGRRGCDVAGPMARGSHGHVFVFRGPALGTLERGPRPESHCLAAGPVSRHGPLSHGTRERCAGKAGRGGARR